MTEGTDEESARDTLDLAERHEDAGAFSLVLEHVPANLGETVTDAIDIPTIGIGAGEMADAIKGYVGAVELGEFPAEELSHYEDENEDVY